MEKKELLKDRLKWNGTLSPCKKRLSTWITSSFSTRFRVTHHGGCAILFNKDTFFPDIKVTSIYLHDLRHSQPVKVIEGETGWVLQGVISKGSFRRKPGGGKSSFTQVSLHINNICGKKRSIGKKILLAIRAVMLDEQIDLVAGNFNGAAWRRQTNNGNLTIIEEAFADSDLPMPSSRLTPLWRPGSDVCGFLKSPNSYECWKVRQHGAFSIPNETLGLRSRDQSCHNEVLHLDFVNEYGDHEPRERHEPRLLLKERSAPYQRSRVRCKADEDVSDHLLSS